MPDAAFSFGGATGQPGTRATTPGAGPAQIGGAGVTGLAPWLKQGGPSQPFQFNSALKLGSGQQDILAQQQALATQLRNAPIPQKVQPISAAGGEQTSAATGGGGMVPPVDISGAMPADIPPYEGPRLDPDYGQSYENMYKGEPPYDPETNPDAAIIPDENPFTNIPDAAIDTAIGALPGGLTYLAGRQAYRWLTGTQAPAPVEEKSSMYQPDEFYDAMGFQPQDDFWMGGGGGGGGARNNTMILDY